MVMVIVFTMSTADNLHASSTRPESVRGIGLGLDLLSKGTNPVPSAGLLWASFAVISYQVRATFSHRFSDNASFIRGGMGFGFIFVLLNFDLTMQTGDQRSAGMYWGLSAFMSGSYLTPEIFAGYQTNFATGSENFLVLGLKCYLNFAELRT